MFLEFFWAENIYIKIDKSKNQNFEIYHSFARVLQIFFMVCKEKFFKDEKSMSRVKSTLQSFYGKRESNFKSE